MTVCQFGPKNASARYSPCSPRLPPWPSRRAMLQRGGPMPLDARTVELMRELFAGRCCCVCGAAAERVVEERYLCHRHFLSGRRPPKAKTVKRRLRRPAAQPAVVELCGESPVSEPA